MKKLRHHTGWRLPLALLALAPLLLATGVDAAPGGNQQATLSGNVTSAMTGCKLAEVSVSVDGVEVVTNPGGKYSVSLDPGDYLVTIGAEHYEPQEFPVSLAAKGKVDQDVALVPVAPVLVETSVEGDLAPGAVFTATVSVEVLNGSTLSDISWTQLGGAAVAFGEMEVESVPGKAFCKADSAVAVATVQLASELEYKEFLAHVLAEPPVTADQLPPNVPLPPGEFPGGLQNRFEMMPSSPFALEEAAVVALEAAVTTSSGVYAEHVELHTHLPWKPSAGIRNVPIGIPVILNGKAQGGYDWALTLPGGSSAALRDAMSQYPDFTPDVTGKYEVTVTDMTGDVDVPVTLEVYAGLWEGAIIGQDGDGRPVTGCTTCHSGWAPDLFTPWAQTGHAEIFSANLDTSTHYGPNCFGCHTVGFDPDVDNGGFDDAPDYQAFLDAGLLNNPGDNWTTMLNDFPAAARLANIQCENCHGPNKEAGHAKVGEPRVSLSSDVCATCHGEPLRHARFQQWQLSGHANYELAIDEGDSGNCSRCHTGNGFLTWLPILLGDEPGDPTASISVDWTADEVHPQTCATCHDPHAIGTTSGSNTDATVRISDDTPLLIAGFVAEDVGRGAICMTCHNSRRGLRNDDTWPDTVASGDIARAPHGSAQTDVLMGQNAYLVNYGIRGAHSLGFLEEIEDTCVSCHMEATPPPDVLSYNQGGTNHTFFARNDICGECHGFTNGDGIQNPVRDDLEELQGMIEGALFDLLAAQIGAGYAIDWNNDLVADLTDMGDVKEIIFGEFRGRQSMTLVFQDDSTAGPLRMSDVDVIDAVPTKIGELYDFADEGLIKAGWNWNLIHNDGSYGVHNPSWVLAVLDASKDALDG
jgi:formate-dependent nitrite reductase cytochrome c552 subunit